MEILYDPACSLVLGVQIVIQTILEILDINLECVQTSINLELFLTFYLCALFILEAWFSVAL